PRAQRVAVHRHRAHLGDGGGARRPWARVEDRELTGHVRRTHDGEPTLVADAPMMVSRFSRRSGERRPILTFPEMMMNSRSPGSPSANTVCPRGKSTGCNCLVSADTALGSTPWKIPALARISSTLPLLSCWMI